MHKIALRAASACGGAIALTVSFAAYDPERPRSRALPIRLSDRPAMLTDYEPLRPQPCLIGVADCLSRYPPPVPCLVSLQRCPGDAVPHPIGASRDREVLPLNGPR